MCVAVPLRDALSVPRLTHTCILRSAARFDLSCAPLLGHSEQPLLRCCCARSCIDRRDKARRAITVEVSCRSTPTECIPPSVAIYCSISPPSTPHSEAVAVSRKRIVRPRKFSPSRAAASSSGDVALGLAVKNFVSRVTWTIRSTTSACSSQADPWTRRKQFANPFCSVWSSSNASTSAVAGELVSAMLTAHTTKRLHRTPTSHPRLGRIKYDGPGPAGTQAARHPAQAARLTTLLCQRLRAGQQREGRAAGHVISCEGCVIVFVCDRISYGPSQVIL